MISIFLIGCKNEIANQFYTKAVEFEEKDKYKEAIEQLDKAIKLNPKFEQAYLDRAIDKSIIQDYEGAISDLDVLIEMRPDGIEPYVWRAEYKRMLDRYEAAILDIEIALKLKNPIIIDSVVVMALEPNYDGRFIKNEKFDIELEYILFERASSNYMLNNDKVAYNDLNFCILKNMQVKECKKMRGMILIASGYKDDGCKDLSDVEEIEKGYALKEIREYCN